MNDQAPNTKRQSTKATFFDSGVYSWKRELKDPKSKQLCYKNWTLRSNSSVFFCYSFFFLIASVMELLSLKAPSVDYSFHCRSCPLAIAGLSANFLNHSTLHISWNLASPPESVTGYDVIIRKENTEVSRVGADNVTSSVEVPSLNQCSNYTVKVAANSSAGPGNYSTLELLTRCGR